MSHAYGKYVKSLNGKIECSNRRTIRINLLKKFGSFCFYCGRHCRNLTLDHIVPLSRGGENRQRNMALCCPTCNSNKADMKASEWWKTKDRTEIVHELLERVSPIALEGIARQV